MSLNPYWTAILAEDTSRFILDPGIIALLIPITALVFGFATVIVKSIIRHRERMRKPVRVESDVGDADVTARGPMRNFAGD